MNHSLNIDSIDMPCVRNDVNIVIINYVNTFGRKEETELPKAIVKDFTDRYVG